MFASVRLHPSTFPGMRLLKQFYTQSLFGMNVNILKDNPDWRWYILFGRAFLILTIVGWLGFK
jgi:hypothetical protein